MMMAPFLGAFFRRRAKDGKEDPSRLHERFAKKLRARPNGHLIWMHAASVGESQLLLELVKKLSDHLTTNVTFLLTCQTQTAAALVKTAISSPKLQSVSLLQQMAPVDTSGAVRRFLDHWKPDVAIIAEGEIWPNLLLQLEKRDIPTALINARMTEKSIKGWLRWRRTARRVFGTLDLLIAADIQTKTGLEALSGKCAICPGNLKSALPPPSADLDELAVLEASIGTRKVLLAASTHSGEEALVLDAYMQMPQKPFLIIAPRHPERGDEVHSLLSCTEFAVSRRSHDETLPTDAEILLADTMGEMGLWYRLADTVYLGGGHAPGVGGHNPLEALQLGKPILTGPSLFNFSDLTAKLAFHNGFKIVQDAKALATSFPANPVSEELIKTLEADSLGPMQATLEALQPLLTEAGLS